MPIRQETFHSLLLVIILAVMSSTLTAESTYPKTGENPQTEKLFEESAEQMGKKDGSDTLFWYDSQKGVVVMRSRKEEPATWATFRILQGLCYPVAGYKKLNDVTYANKGKELKPEDGIPVSNAGHFTIYHHGHLLIDADIVKKVDQNGRQKERCHLELGDYNTIVIDDDDQILPEDKGYKPPKLLAFENDENFAYVSADLTGAYRNMEWFTRQFVFFRPNFFVVFDRVKTTGKLSKIWTLNFIEEPILINGDTIMAQTTAERSGQIFVKRLLPVHSVFVRRFHGEHGPWGSWCAWRTQWQPKELTESELFLNVFFVSRTITPMSQEIDLIKIKDRVGVRINTGEVSYQVLFDKMGETGGEVGIETMDSEKEEKWMTTYALPIRAVKKELPRR